MNPLKFSCQHCGSVCSDHSVRVPGPVVQGRFMMQQNVCLPCQQRVVTALSEDFFSGTKTSDPTKCNRCGSGFDISELSEHAVKLSENHRTKPTGPYYAHIKPVVGGLWITAPVCYNCFAEFQKCCEANANKMKKSQGGVNGNAK
jgi:hypothetical protein